MAHVTVARGTAARDHLLALRDHRGRPTVSVIDAPLPRRPEIAAAVLAGLRLAHICTDGDTFSAAVHLRLGEWMTLAEGVPEEAAFAAVLHFVRLVASIPSEYSAQGDAAERAAAAEVFAAFAAPLSMAA